MTKAKNPSVGIGTPTHGEAATRGKAQGGRIGCCCVWLTLFQSWAFAQPGSQTEAHSAGARIRNDAVAVQSLVHSTLAREFLAEAVALPSVAPRVLYRPADKSRYYREADYLALPEEQRADLQKVEISEELYYFTKYGTPVAYVRAIELLGEKGLDSLTGRRILDFGYGSVGHLRMLAGMGADVVGVDVDPFLTALYGQPEDQGRVQGASQRVGTVKLVNGRFPADAAVKAATGNSFDLIISKNTLKNGYLHPAEPVDERKLVKLGVEDESFVKELFAVLRPGGRVLIYNICPAPAPPGKPYIPWADGRSPFSIALWEAAGFKVLAFDQDDTVAARSMGHALGWDEGDGAMDLQTDLFALYTLVEKPGTQ